MARTIFESVFTNPGKPFRFVGRYSFLDFINTEASEADGRVNLLTDDQDFVTWLVLAKLFERNKLKVALETMATTGKQACAFGRMRLRCVR